MKHLSLILNAVLVVAVIVLFILHFSSNHQSSSNDSPMIEQAGSMVQGTIVYVDLDSLLLNYEFSKQLNMQFNAKQDKMRSEMQVKAAKFEKEAGEFQEKLQRGGFLTEERAKSEQERLLAEQQRLQQLDYDLQNSLTQEQQQLNQVLYDSISNFLKDYNKTHNYQFIISHAYGGALLYANKKLDITVDVLERLNARIKKK